MQKKTFFVLSLAITLLGLNLNQLQAQGAEFVIPANSYRLSSNAGTFTDIADNPATVKLGESLPNGTLLRNGFFVNDPASDNFVTHTADKTKTDPGFPLGFTFNLCGKQMTHFTVCASGGIHFGANTDIPQAQSSAWYTSTADYQNILTVSTLDNNGKRDTVYSIAGKAPVMYLIEGEAGQKVLTVQYDYAIHRDGDEWVYQIKAYEATGRMELVVKELKAEHADNGAYRLFFGLAENGNSSINNDPLKTMNLNYCDTRLHIVAFNQTAVGSWDNFAVYTSQSIGNGLYINATTKPEAGRTLAFELPACSENGACLDPDAYTLVTTAVSKTSFTGKISYNKDKMTAEALAKTGTVVAVLSTSPTPDYTLSDGIWHRAGDPIGQSQGQTTPRILLNAKPAYRFYNGNISGTIGNLDLKADGLTAGTVYYIHIYSMSYQCLDAPTYSGLCTTFSFTSSIDLPKKLSAGLPTTSSVPVTVQSAGEGFGVVLLKSPNTNPVTLSGKLTEGQKIGDIEVLKVLNSAAETKIDAPFNAGEGAYLLAVSATGLDSETPTYAADFLSVPVRAAYDQLPTWEFSQEKPTYSAPDQYPNLPFGWQREIELPEKLRAYAFGIRGGDGDPVCMQSSYAAGITDWVDVVTPAFIATKSDLQASFIVSYLKNAEVGDPVRYTAGQNDEIRLEYAIGEGPWTALLQLKGNDYEFPAADAQGRYTISGNLRKIAVGSTIRLRYSYKSPASEAMIHHRIHKVAIIEGRECLPPTAVAFSDSLSTDQSLNLHWTDANYPAAAAFVLAYRKAATTDSDDVTAWRYRRISTPDNHPQNTPLTAQLPDLDAATLYTAQVAAICGTRDTSFYSPDISTQTAFALPYEESMAQTGTGANAQTPFDRGVKTYVGTIGGTLAETAESTWSQAVTSDAYNRATAVSIGDFTSNAWLVLPAVFTAENGDFTPKSLHFTLSSFDADKNKGVRPNHDDTKLHILASKNGRFTRNDILKTLEAEALRCNDSTLTLDLAEREGRMQIAFVFECPSALQQPEEGDNPAQQPEETEPWYLEISQVRITYDVEVCFPVNRLRRSLGSNSLDVSWEAPNGSEAVEYGIFWGLAAGGLYTDSAYTKETDYTITGLEEQTRYNIKVVSYCSEDRSLYSEPATTAATTLLGCHTPTGFAVSHITQTGADFSSQTDQPDHMTLRLVYIWPENDEADLLVCRQTADTLHLRDSLTERIAYIAATRAVCGTDTSAMSDEIRFVTETAANEDAAQINALFNVRTQEGRVLIRNLNGLLIQQVSIYSLSGNLLTASRPDSRDDVDMPVEARHALLFIRLQTEKGTAVYKVYLP